MADATRKDNYLIIQDTNTISGPLELTLILTSEGQSGILAMSINGTQVIKLATSGHDTVTSPCCYIPNGTTATFALVGNNLSAFAVIERE